MGFSGWGPEQQPSEAEIYHFYLHPHSWGKGRAGHFMELILQELKGAGYTQVHLWTLEANHRALKFYAKWGFVVTGHRQEQIRWGFTLREVRLVKPLH